MKDLDITAVFCEMLSGIALMLVVAAGLDVSGACSLAKLVIWIKMHPGLGAAATLIVAAYLAGLIVDAFGMAFDTVVQHVGWLNHFLRYDAGTMPAAFYANVTAHVLKYWGEQWTYFSCYRNLLLLSPLGVPCFLIVSYKYGGRGWFLVTACVLAFTVAALILAIRSLQCALADTAVAAAAGKPMDAASDDVG